MLLQFVAAEAPQGISRPATQHKDFTYSNLFQFQLSASKKKWVKQTYTWNAVLS